MLSHNTKAAHRAALVLWDRLDAYCPYALLSLHLHTYFMKLCHLIILMPSKDMRQLFRIVVIGAVPVT